MNSNSFRAVFSVEKGEELSVFENERYIAAAIVGRALESPRRP